MVLVAQFSSSMKKLALVLLLAGSPFALADDSTNLIRNGDFSSGISHWEGDCHSPSSNDAPADLSAGPNSPSVPQGVYIQLRPGDWTKMTQDFEGKEGTYTFSISYALSSDATFSTSADDYSDIPGATGMSRFPKFGIRPGTWGLIVLDLGAWRYWTWEVDPPAAGKSTTYTTAVKITSTDGDKTLCLVFPPGNGVVTITKVSMVPAQSQ
jgi:hypothetical protein